MADWRQLSCATAVPLVHPAEGWVSDPLADPDIGVGKIRGAAPIERLASKISMSIGQTRARGGSGNAVALSTT